MPCIIFVGLTRWPSQLAFSPSAALYFFCFFLHIVAFGDNVEEKKSLFHAAAGEKDIWFTRPRKSCDKPGVPAEAGTELDQAEAGTELDQAEAGTPILHNSCRIALCVA